MTYTEEELPRNEIANQPQNEVKVKNNNPLDSFGQKLKVLRGSLSQSKTSQVFGIAQQTYAGWKSDRRKPTITELRDIALHYGITTDYLVGISEESSTKQTHTPNMNGVRHAVSQLRANAEKAMHKAEELMQIIDEIERTL